MLRGNAIIYNRERVKKIVAKGNEGYDRKTGIKSGQREKKREKKNERNKKKNKNFSNNLILH